MRMSRHLPIAAVSFLVASVLGAGPIRPAAGSDVTTTISTDGTYVVPSGVSELLVTVTGAGGGRSSEGQATGTNLSALPVPGGYGDTVTATLEVQPGDRLAIVVGQAGGDGATPATRSDVGGLGGRGYGNGGRGGDALGDDASGGGGGGGSAILLGSEPLVVAGGGGGGSGALAILELGSPVNIIGGCVTSPGSPPAPFVPPCPSTTPPTTGPPMRIWGPICSGLGPGIKPAPICRLATPPPSSVDGSDGAAAVRTVDSANPAGGGGGGGARGGSGGANSTTPLVSGGGQGGTDRLEPTRTSAISIVGADNAGLGGSVTITPISSGSPLPSVPTQVKASTIATPAKALVAQPTYTG